jgi:hypothetical protein
MVVLSVVMANVFMLNVAAPFFSLLGYLKVYTLV